LVAWEIERREDHLAELCTLAQDRLDGVWGCIGKARKIVVALDGKDIVQKEHHVFDGGLVDRHGTSSRAGEPGNGRQSAAAPFSR
jgi:hypothetical protein